MAARKSPSPNPEDVFLNIPFDEGYGRLYLALIAGLTTIGLTPRSVLEIPPVQNRLERLIELIQSCGSSIHDLSRVELSPKKPRCPRFNMPFETGLAVAWAHAAPVEHRWFLLEAVPFRVQKSLSDVNGFDPFIHKGTVEGLCSALTKAFYRPEVTTDQLLKNYRRLRPIATDLKQRGRFDDLFNGAAFKNLVLAGQKLAVIDRRVTSLIAEPRLILEGIPFSRKMGRVRHTRPFVLLALAALLAPRAEASRTSVWEQNPPAAFSVARTEAASALASIAPAAVADVEAEEPRRFDLGDVILVERELGHEERLDLGPLTLVDLNLLRGPLSSYPETRVRGFELLPPFRVGASASLSLWPRRACGSISCGLVSDGPEDPWGLRTFFTADVGPGDVLPTLNMETGNTAVDAVLGVGNNLFNLAAKFVNAGMNFGKGAAVVQDKLDEKVAEKGIACRGCTSFGIDMAGALSGTREAQAAYEVLGAYGRALSGRFAPAPAVGAGEAGAAVEKSSSPSQLKAGRSWEEAELASLGKTKNTEVWRPTPEDIDSAAFKTVVGPAKYTPKGLPVGTSVDVAEAGGSIEIKGGTKVLESSYQLRLQTYHALKTETPLTIRTARPVNPTFADWLSRWGVNVENPSVVKPATGGAP